MGPIEQTVLEVLRTHADRLTWLTIQDRQWAKVLLDHARNDESIHAPEFEGSFDNALDFLEGRGLTERTTRTMAGSIWARYPRQTKQRG
jgi:hypothetical protein